MIWQNDPRAILTGGVLINRKSTPYSDIPLPKLVTDPLYTSSQSSLDKIGQGLLTGDVPDYYKSIGDFNSPQFQAMLNSVKGQIMQGSQESSAIQGTGRSGVATTASNNSLNSVLPQLTYQDYTRALAGRGALLGAGIDTESGVRQSAQNQQQFDTNFNQQIFADQLKIAGLMDSWKKDASQAEGQMFGNIASTAGPLVGGLGGFLVGGPGGAVIGSQIGGALGGVASGALGGAGNGGSDLSSLFASLGNINATPTDKASFGNSDNSLGTFSKLSSFYDK